MWKWMNKNGFTLVELIVVVTILAILSTIGFVAYSWYLSGVRDTNRVSNLKSIHDWINLSGLNKSLPLPEDNIEVIAKWEVIAWQWYAGKNILDSIEFTTNWVDPKTKQYFSYYLNAEKKDFQLMGFLENEDKLQNYWVEANNSLLSPTVYGERLWILTDEDNAPIHEISTYIDQWNIDLGWINANDIIHVHVSDGISYQFDSQTLENRLYTLSKPSKYWKIKSCPNGFIWSWWSAEFDQPGFCISQYEMWFVDESGKNDTSTDGDSDAFATYEFEENNRIVSRKGKTPIAEIQYNQAKLACESLWDWYQLTTHNQWMSVARNIELEASNWNNGIIGQWYIYTWNAGESSDGKWCREQWNVNKYAWAKTWIWEASCNQKRKHTLFLWEDIWDFSGNVWEIVDKQENSRVDLWSWDMQWDSVSGSDLKNQYGPLLDLNTDNGAGFIYNADWLTGELLLRWWSGWDESKAWIYSIDSGIENDYENWNTGFRCTYTN